MSTEVIEGLLRSLATEWHWRAFDREPPYTFAAVSFPIEPHDEIVILVCRGEVTRDVRDFIELDLDGHINEAPPASLQGGLDPPTSRHDGD